MPVATVGDCGSSGGPSSPRAQQFLQKFWADRQSSSFNTKVDIESYPDGSDVSSISLVENESGEACEALRCKIGCRRQESIEIVHHQSGDNPLVEPSKLNRYVEKTPLLAVHNLGCAATEASSHLLPLDLIQNNVDLEDNETELNDPCSSNAPTCPSVYCQPSQHCSLSHTPGGSLSGLNLSHNYCSCHQSFKPRLKSYEKTLQNSGRIPLMSASDPRARDPQATKTTCWCWSSKLVIYTIYLCVVFIVTIFTEVARVTIVPITAFLIILSLALFLFILFCVCFIIYI